MHDFITESTAQVQSWKIRLLSSLLGGGNPHFGVCAFCYGILASLWWHQLMYLCQHCGALSTNVLSGAGDILLVTTCSCTPHFVQSHKCHGKSRCSHTADFECAPCVQRRDALPLMRWVETPLRQRTAGDNGSDKSLCHSQKFISLVSCPNASV